jgi:GPH family glycoside/pentoside/hexuronide:cation symporter
MTQASAPAAALSEPTIIAPQPAQPLRWSTKLLFAGPALAANAMILPILINMPKFYADVMMVPLGYLALIIAFGRSFDAIIDPAIGWISDRTRTRWGRRRPFVFAFAPLGALAYWALMSPAAGLKPVSAAVWYCATGMACSLFLTLTLLPQAALGPELTLDYNERNSLFGVSGSFGIVGTIIAATTPGFLIARWGWNERQVFSSLGLIFALGLVALCWLMVIFIRERPEFAGDQRNPLVPGARRAFRNRPFRILLACFVAFSVTGSMGPILMPFFNTYVVQPANPGLWLSIQLMAVFGVGFLCVPLVVATAKRFGKLRTWLAGVAVGITLSLLVFLLVGKGNNGLFLLINCLSGIPFAAGLVLPISMMADVIDYDELHTGLRREAQYFAFWSILPKLAAIPGAAIPIAILASVGYVSNSTQSPAVIFAIRLLFGLVPMLGSVVAFIFLCLFPINEANHLAMLEGIERHQRGDNAIDPLSGREIPPTSGRGVDEATGWFLDNFSQRELKRLLAQGPEPIVRGVRRAAAVAIALCLIFAYITVRGASSLSTDPGTIASLSVVVSGSALTIFLFHLLRMAPARRLASGAISGDAIRAHLNDCREGRI